MNLDRDCSAKPALDSVCASNVFDSGLVRYRAAPNRRTASWRSPSMAWA